MKRYLWLAFFLWNVKSYSQIQPSLLANKWVDSVFNSLSEEEKIAQLMIVRLSSIDGASRKPVFYEKAVTEAIKQYNIGGVCLFQGGPQQQAALINRLQSIAKTPLLISIDAENGLGMRMDSVAGLPRQMMMGAVGDPSLIYEYGRWVGEQCKRMGIQLNYAPVVDINNNPANPVINDRSFGEDKHKVALYGIQYMRGMQEVGVMACAKHFPGHGDVAVDSHYDLPVVNKSRKALDSMELYPFRQLIQAGVAAVMVAHLSVPAIDNTANTASSISYKNVTGLLRNELGYTGLVLTDALEMKGVSKYSAPAEVSVQSLLAGNDMLCLPGDIPGSIDRIKDAVKQNKLSREIIDSRVKKALLAKYQYGLSAFKPVDPNRLIEDLNRKTSDMTRLIAENAITLLRNDDPSIFPLRRGRRVAYVGVGISKDNELAAQVRKELDAHTYYFDYKMGEDKVAPLLELIRNRYDVVLIGVHNYSRFPAKEFGISKAAISLVKQLQQQQRTITMAFGNPYAIKNICDSRVLVACYEDGEIVQKTAADLLSGRFTAKGKLPVTICESFQYGDGITDLRLLPTVRPADLGFNVAKLLTIDSIVTDAIYKQATPGAVALVVKDGKIAYERAFGYQGYDSLEPVYPETIYDVASLTKIMATTLSVMKLYEEGRLSLSATLGDYLPWTKGTNKARLRISNLLLHQAGLKAWIPFYRETVEPTNAGNAGNGIYSPTRDSLYTIRVAEEMYMRRDWKDTIYKRILDSPLGPQGVYVYSDLDFIFLGNVVESITGMPLYQYARETFYDPLKLKTIGFNPRQYFPLYNIAPTETDFNFRMQLIRGDVHDPGAAMLGGVAGHAGLFSDAYDLAVLCQVLVNGGRMNGIQFFKKSTIDLFTAYHGASRRGLGFDKPEKDNSRRDPYPTLSASPLTFGHTGFTGACAWVDPKYKLIYIFLSNRVYSNGDANRFNRMNVRPKVHETIYQALLGNRKPPASATLTKAVNHQTPNL